MAAIRLTTKRIEKPWGRTKLWAGFGSVAPGGEPVGEIWFEAPGDPELLIKYLFTSEKLSIQVHPDDTVAQAHGYPRGKDEAWVVLAAEPRATIAIGTMAPMTQDELRRAALDGTIEKLVDWKAVKTGDVYYSPARTVHAIGPGLTLVEVQQNVDLTYRLYDYGRPRELHLDEGIAASNPVPYVAPYVAKELTPGRTILADHAAFVLERWTRSGEATLASDGRPIWLVPLEGGGAFDDEGFEACGVWLAEGETALRVDPGTELLVVYPGAGVIDRLWEPDV
ncbi:class I mannose-6-phosphate isomerase [Sphingomonas sanxanigenens]|uniref:Phosphoheptose isomerase n=1 Tax=Sphingomonas sanxanigenens DSM 19645 = NX02 TaxID=1123269 RepID=A0A0F7JVT5_9SPHN|nr:class I mannose-6-phosphate isomerase [Sphingomonas sanxanigenens]AKH18870.1 phosphoheptose isomerase [Sphingomonas sanxanigenens DSM 19645 = NX02]